MLGAVSLSPPGRQNYSIGCSSVLGAGRSSPRDRLISIANNKVYHVLHPHQKTLSSGISLEYLTTPLIALHNIGWEKKILLYRHWNVFLTTKQKKKKCNWTSKKSLKTSNCPWTSRLSNFSDAFIEAISIYSAGFKKEMIAILNTLDLSFWLCKMSQNFVETDNTSFFGS